MDINKLSRDLKELLVETLMLEDVVPSEIEDDQALFGSGLDLDSIDALVRALSLKQRYCVELHSDDVRNKGIFRSILSLSAFVAVHRAS